MVGRHVGSSALIHTPPFVVDITYQLLSMLSMCKPAILVCIYTTMLCMSVHRTKATQKKAIFTKRNHGGPDSKHSHLGRS